jgi:hypothetical protein
MLEGWDDELRRPIKHRPLGRTKGFAVAKLKADVAPEDV